MMMLGREMQLPLHVVVGIPCGEKYPYPETYVDVLTRQVVHDTESYVWHYCPTLKKVYARN